MCVFFLVFVVVHYLFSICCELHNILTLKWDTHTQKALVLGHVGDAQRTALDQSGATIHDPLLFYIVGSFAKPVPGV